MEEIASQLKMVQCFVSEKKESWVLFTEVISNDSLLMHLSGKVATVSKYTDTIQMFKLTIFNIQIYQS